MARGAPAGAARARRLAAPARGARAAPRRARAGHRPPARWRVAARSIRCAGAAERAVGSGLDPPRAALARGMVLGEDEALDEATREDFRVSGLAHLLAASGQNVMLLVALGLPLAALGRRPARAAPRLLVLIALYVPLAGRRSLDPARRGHGRRRPRRRAGQPAGLALVRAAARRGGHARRWIRAPPAIPDGSCPSPRSSDPRCSPRRSRRAARARRAGAARGGGGAHHRRRPSARRRCSPCTSSAVSIVSLPANLLAAPAVAPVMWLGMLAVAPAPLIPARRAAQRARPVPLAYLGGLAHAAAAVPAASVAARVALARALVAADAALAVAGPAPCARGGPRRAAVVTAAGRRRVAGCRGRAPAGGRPARSARRRRLVPRHRPGRRDPDPARRRHRPRRHGTSGRAAERRLRDAGVRRIDLLVVTHAQADHDGGAAGVLDRLPVGLLLDGGDGSPDPAAPRHGGRRRPSRRPSPRARRGPVPARGAARAARPVAAPRAAGGHAGEDPNQRAIVAHLRAGAFDLLLPADAESDVTAALDLPPVEALKVAHHGSADPGVPDLLARLHPASP